MKFVCHNCNEERDVSRCTIKASGGQIAHIDKSTNEEVVCTSCGNAMDYVPKPGGFNVSYGEFTSMSRDEKITHLKERSRHHTKKNFHDG